MPTTLFIDLDATLVENKFSFRAVGELLQEIADATGKDIAEIGPLLGQENARRQTDDPDNVLTMDWDDIIETVARQQGVTLSRKLLDGWQKYASADDVDVLDNAPDVLRQLRAPHRQLVLATKGLSKYQIPVLTVTHMRDLLDDMLTPDITGYLKTTPAYFDKYTQNAPDDMLFIQLGDHYYDDVICAKRNGFYSVMRAPIEALRGLDPFERPAHLAQYISQIKTYPEEGSDVLPDAVVVSLQEAPAVIERIERGDTQN